MFFLPEPHPNYGLLHISSAAEILFLSFSWYRSIYESTGRFFLVQLRHCIRWFSISATGVVEETWNEAPSRLPPTPRDSDASVSPSDSEEIDRILMTVLSILFSQTTCQLAFEVSFKCKSLLPEGVCSSKVCLPAKLVRGWSAPQRTVRVATVEARPPKLRFYSFPRTAHAHRVPEFLRLAQNEAKRLGSPTRCLCPTWS